MKSKFLMVLFSAVLALAMMIGYMPAVSANPSIKPKITVDSSPLEDVRFAMNRVNPGGHAKTITTTTLHQFAIKNGSDFTISDIQSSVDLTVGGETYTLDYIGYRVGNGDLQSTPITFSNVTSSMKITLCYDTSEVPLVAFDQTVITSEQTPVDITLAAYDAEGDSLTYSIASQPANGELSEVSGDAVTYTPAPGFIGKDSFTFTAADATETSNEATVTIIVTGIQLSNNSVEENLPAGTEIGTFSAVDEYGTDIAEIDMNQYTFTYTLVDATTYPDNEAFVIEGNTLKTNAVFDYETRSSYTINVEALNNDSLTSSTQQFTIEVIDQNAAPTEINLDNNTVNEHEAAGTIIGTFSTIDPDAEDTFTYELYDNTDYTGDLDNSAFVIDGDTLKAAVSFNYEIQNLYTIDVKSIDQGGLSFDKIFTITVNDINGDPTDIALSNSSVDENLSEGALVGTFTTTDPDIDDVFTYELYDNNDFPGNLAFIIDNNDLKTAASFNFEAQNVYDINVMTTDLSGYTFVKEFTITVNDVNEAPKAENQNVNTNQDKAVAITLTATDEDVPANTLTYSLVEGEGPANGTLSALDGAAVTYTPTASFYGTDSFKFKVNDGSLDSEIATVNITVNQTFTLTVSIEGDGQVSRSSQGPYTLNQEVTLTATANSGYKFSAWSGAVTGTENPVTITMDGNKTVKATFVVRTTGGGGGGGGSHEDTTTNTSTPTVTPTPTPTPEGEVAEDTTNIEDQVVTPTPTVEPPADSTDITGQAPVTPEATIQSAPVVTTTPAQTNEASKAGMAINWWWLILILVAALAVGGGVLYATQHSKAKAKK